MIAMLEVSEHTKEVFTSCGVSRGQFSPHSLFGVHQQFASLSDSLSPLKTVGFTNNLGLWIEDSLSDENGHSIAQQWLLRDEGWS